MNGNVTIVATKRTSSKIIKMTRMNNLETGRLLDLSYCALNACMGVARDYKNLYCTRKGAGKKEFGYWHSRGIAQDIVKIIKKLNYHRYGCSDILDLGCGAGLLMAQINCLAKDIETNGIDNERKLLIIARRLAYDFGCGRFYEKNLLKLKPEDLQGYKFLYTYEPFCEESHQKKFAEILSEAMFSGQILIYRAAGRVGSYLEQSGEFKKANKIRYIKGGFRTNFGYGNVFVYVKK